MGAVARRSAFLGTLFFLALNAGWAGMNDWFLLRPPQVSLSVDLDGLLASSGPPQDDDDDGDDLSSSISEEVDADGENLNWLLHFLLGQHSAGFGGLDEDDANVLTSLDGINDEYFSPSLDSDVLQGRLLSLLEESMRMEIAWQPWERLGVDAERVFRFCPNLRLYAEAPNEPYVDPEFEAHLFGFDYESNYEGNPLALRLYLLVRARWMDAFMPSHQVITAWGNVALNYTENPNLMNAIHGVMDRPWLNASWLALCDHMQYIEHDLVLHAIVRLIYAKLKISSQQFQFSVVMPYLLVLPGLSREERLGVISYFNILICESVEHNPTRADTIYEAILECLKQRFVVEEAQHLLVLLNKLWNCPDLQNDLHASLFLLEALRTVGEEGVSELLLLNTVARLVFSESEVQPDCVDYAFERLSKMFVRGIFSEKGKMFVLELLGPFLKNSSEHLPAGVHALGILLSDPNLDESLFLELWKKYSDHFNDDLPSVVSSVLRTLPAILGSHRLSSSEMNRCSRYIRSDNLFDGAFAIDVMLHPGALDRTWNRGFDRIIWGIAHQPSSDFWNHARERLPALLSLDLVRMGSGKTYYQRIIKELLKIVYLPQKDGVDPVALFALRGDALEILVKHWMRYTGSVENAFALLQKQGVGSDTPPQVLKIWFWLLQSEILDVDQLESSINWLLSQKHSNANRCLAVALCNASINLDLRVQVLEHIYKNVDLKTLVTLLLKGVSWVQQAKLLYGIAHGVAYCCDEAILSQVQLKLVKSGYLQEQIVRALSERHCDLVAERYLSAAYCFLRSMGEANLFVEYLLPYRGFLLKVLRDEDCESAVALSAKSWLERLKHLEEKGAPFADEVFDENKENLL